MKFEFDEAKSAADQVKHGIDFEKAQELWKNPSVKFVARKEYEDRFAIIGPIEGSLFTCIYTLRGTQIRIISCRRSRKQEGILYEKTIKETTYGWGI